MWNNYLDQFIDNALREDIGDGDHTSLACIPASAKGKVQLLIKEDGVLAGVEFASHVFKKLDKNCNIKYFKKDGDAIKAGDIAFIAEGKVLALLQAERLVLNLMQRLSGIATQTRSYVEKLQGLPVKILDTRKTTSGMRLLEKSAVKLGGGENHRIGLYDMILIKDNHIDFSGGIEQAVTRVHEYLMKVNKKLKIEIEARNLSDVEKILDVEKVDRILLDNFSVEQTLEAVKLINKRIETESSGGITLKNIRSYAECGVDYISVGALTHQIRSLDMSLKAIDF